MQRILYILMTLLIMSEACVVNAQTFSRVDPGFSRCHDPAAAWVDLDNNGNLDIFISGADENNLPDFHLYRIEANGSYTEFFPPITGVTDAACAFGDMNNDGLADLALSGYNGSTYITKVYRNDGGFVFSDISAGITGLKEGSISWADYDHDGYTDLLVSGLDNNGYPLTKLYHNENGNGFTDANVTISGLSHSSLAWSDFDKDEDMDFAICGKDSMLQAKTYIYINEEGTFTKMGAGLSGLWGGMLDWGDYNNDGYADLVISGSNDNNASVSLVYKNNAGLSFTQLAGPYDGVSDGSSFWGDFDNDGQLDFIIAGRYRSGIIPLPPPDDPFLKVYFNQGNDQFQSVLDSLPVPDNNYIVCGDYDNDSDLDLLLTGAFVNPISGGNDHTVLFRNETPNVNNPPSAPAGLSYEVSDTDLIFHWSATNDDSTPAAGLNYNFRIGTAANNMDIVSALADLSDGYRRIPDIGNTGPNVDLRVSGIPFGEYLGSVQAIDHSFAGSLFSDDIIIIYLPTANFTVDDSVCAGNGNLVTITYTGNATAAGQYSWDFDGAEVLSGSGQGPYVLYWENEGLKTVSLTVTENGMTSIPVSHFVMVIKPVLSSGTVSGETDFCQGTLSTEYFVSPITGAATYAWELDPPNAGSIIGNGQTVAVEWDASFAGSAEIAVRGENFCGTGPLSNILEIVVQPKPGKPGMPDGPTDLCQDPENSTFTSSGASNGLSYVWELTPANAGNIINNGGLQVEINWNDAYTGPAEIKLLALNTCGFGPMSDTLQIIIQIPPVANAGENDTINYQTSTQLQGSASGGSGSYSYYWMPDELLSDPTVLNPTTLAMELSEDFILTVTDELSGCTSEDQVRVIVLGGPLSVNAIANPEEICVGDTIQLDAIPSGGSGNFSFLWSSDPFGFSSSISDPQASPDVTTTYFVTVTDGIDVATDSVLVIVNPLPSNAGEIGGPNAACPGDEGVLYQIDFVPEATHYIWELAEGIFGSSDSTSIFVSFADHFINPGGLITVTPINSCGSGGSSWITIEFGELPAKPQMIFGPDSLCTTTDTIVTYTLDEPIPGAMGYDWILLPEEAGSIVGDGLTGEVHWVQNWEGSAEIRVRSINECGYSGWSDPFSVNTFSCVGIFEAEAEGADIVVYPNPANQFLNVMFIVSDDELDPALCVYDIYGRKMEELKLIHGRGIQQINTSAYPTGLYFITLYDKHRIFGTGKFIISR